MRAAVLVCLVVVGCARGPATPDASRDAGRTWADPDRDEGPPLSPTGRRCAHPRDGAHRSSAWSRGEGAVYVVGPTFAVGVLPDGTPIAAWREVSDGTRELTTGATGLSALVPWSLSIVVGATESRPCCMAPIRPSLAIRGSAPFVFGLGEDVHDAMMLDPGGPAVRARFTLPPSLEPGAVDEVVAVAPTRTGFVALYGPLLALQRLDEGLRPIEPLEPLDVYATDPTLVATEDGASLALWHGGRVAMALDEEGRVAVDPLGRSSFDPWAETTAVFDGARVVTTLSSRTTADVVVEERDVRGVLASSTPAPEGEWWLAAFGTDDGLVVLADGPDEPRHVELVERETGRSIRTLATAVEGRGSIAPECHVAVADGRAFVVWRDYAEVSVIEIPCDP